MTVFLLYRFFNIRPIMTLVVNSLKIRQIPIATVKKEVVVIFVHGFGANGSWVHRYVSRNYLLADIVSFFDFSDAVHIPEQSLASITLFLRSCKNLTNTYLGQQDDIERLKNAIQEVIQRYPEAIIVLYGFSRGAATIINTLGLLGKINSTLLPYIKGAILESPFADMNDILGHLLRFLPTETRASLFYQIFKNHNLRGEQPIDMETYIPGNIPLLFISCHYDFLVPHTSTARLHQKIKATRGVETDQTITLHTQLSYGVHAHMFCNEYQRAVHEFFTLVHALNNH